MVCSVRIWCLVCVLWCVHGVKCMKGKEGCKYMVWRVVYGGFCRVVSIQCVVCSV